MVKTEHAVPLQELNLTDRFLFDEVMEDKEAHQAALSIVMGREIPLLEPGIPDYNCLNDSYLITVMPFDLFGYGKYQYTFVTRCEEVPECRLCDGAVRIFLNTKGNNDSEVSGELIQLLHYMEHTTEENAKNSGSDRIKRIHSRVCKVKASEEIGVKYMQAWEEKYYDRKEAREEGLKEGIEEGLREGIKEGAKEKLKQLVQKMLKKGMAVTEIAELLEEDETLVLELSEALSAEKEIKE